MRRGKSAKAGGEEKTINQAALIGLIAAFWVAVFGLIARTRREEHWDLEQPEALYLAKLLYTAFETLPGHLYARVEILIKYILPWVAVAVGVGTLIEQRVEYSNKIAAERRSTQANQGYSEGSAQGHAGIVNGLS